MRPYETCVPEWVKNESMFLNPGTVSHRFKSMQLNRIEAPAAKLRSPNDLDVKKCALEAAKSTRSTKIKQMWCVLHFFCFFYGSLKLCRQFGIRKVKAALNSLTSGNGGS